MKKRLTLIALLLSFVCTQNLAFATYNDVTEDSPYKEAIDYLELVGATDDATSFRPDDLLTKAEFYKIVFKIFQDDLPSGITRFSDVPQDAWYAPYAHLAFNNQLETSTLFEPAKNMERIEVYEKLLAAYGITGGIVPWSERTVLFSDISSVHPYYSVIAKLVEEGILTADPKTPLKAYGTLTRGECAAIILQFEEWHLQKLKVEESYFYKNDIFADIWNKIINDFYLSEDQTINQDALFNAAVKGMLDSLSDPFTTYFTPDQGNEFEESLSGSFEGIGAYLNQDELTGAFSFTGFIQGSPAEASELEIDDIITAVDGVSTDGLTLSEVIGRIKGPEGTDVKITVKRGDKTLTYVITRAAVEIKLVDGKILNRNTWYIDIDVFGSTTVTDYEKTVSSLKDSVPTPKAIILDLRSNGGGYINMAAQIIGNFLPEFTTLVTLDYGEYSQDIVNSVDGKYQDIPLYILVNGNTASASEILTQDLKEMAGAIVIGTQTYGKGSAQTLTEFWDGSELKLTIAHWLSGKGTSIHGVGVTPDVTIPSDQASAEDLWLKAAEKRIERL